MMRRIFLSLFLLCLCLYSHAAESYEEVPGSGLFIESVPSGAKVFIDGAERGTTPYSNSSLRTGEHTIRITKEGYSERRFNVTIRTGSRVEISVDLKELKGQVLLELAKDPTASLSLEFNPRLFIDGVHIPYEQELSVAEGWRTISAEAFGWEKASTRIYVEEGSVQKLELVLKPASFALTNVVLRKKRFNPRDSGILGTAEINFTVSAPGRGILEVFDSRGELIYSGELNPFTGWQQQALWDGRDLGGNIAGDGHYVIRLSAWDNSETEKQGSELSIQVDSSIAMRPLSLASSVAGLFLVPSPEALPAFSYQVDGSIIAGKPLLQGAWKTLPFAIGIRVSFLDKLEAAFAFNAMPGFQGDHDAGAGASLKWVFFRPPGIQTGDKSFSGSFGMAAELSYGWATTGPYTAFGMGTGAGMRLPLLYRLMQGTASTGNYSFDVLFSPLFLWASEEGYPDSLLPRLGIEGGALFTYGNIGAGISLRWDYDTRAQNSGPFVSALEFKFFPSSFVISLSGGFWFLPDKNETGGFFGVGMGIMY